MQVNDDDHCRDFLCGFTEWLDCIAVIMEANQMPRVNYDASFPFDGSALVLMRLTIVPRTLFIFCTKLRCGLIFSAGGNSGFVAAGRP